MTMFYAIRSLAIHVFKVNAVARCASGHGFWPPGRALPPWLVTEQRINRGHPMRHSTLALACSLALLAGCSHHDSDSPSTPAANTASVNPVGWHADALKQALDADTGDKKPYTCTLDFAHAMRPSAIAAVTIPGLIERVDDTHATVQASSPELAEKAIHAAAFVYQVQDCEAPLVMRKVDASFSADKYAQLELDPISTLGNYYAVAAGPIPYADEAQHFDPAYQETTDTFKRHDLLPAFQAKLDQAVATAKANDGHVRVSFNAQLGHYDFNAHTFTFAIPFDQKMYLNPAFPNGGAASDVQVTFADSPKFNRVTIPDETKAREIEDAVNKAAGTVVVDVDAQVVGTKIQSNTLRVLILAPIALHASSGNVMGPRPHLFDIQ